MPRASRRELWLAILAAINLVVWAVVATTVALVASDRVDLGIESLARRVQTTAIASLPDIGQASSDFPTRHTNPASTSGVSASTELGASNPQPLGAGGSELPALATAEGTGRTPHPGSAGTALSAAEATVAQAEATTSGAETALIDQPLLLANPELSSLDELSSEMRRSAVGRSAQIGFDEAGLNRLVAALLSDRPDFPFQRVYLDLEQGEVIATGTVPMLGVPVNAQVEAGILAINCGLQVDLRSIAVSSVIAPGFIRNSIEAEIEKAVRSYPSDSQLCIQRVILEEGRATLYGYRR